MALIRRLLAITAILMLLGPAIYLGGDVILARGVLIGARTFGGVTGLDDLSFKIKHLALDRLRLEQVRVGDIGPQIGGVDLSFDIRDLLRGHLAKATIDGAVIVLDAGPDGPVVRGLPELFAQPGVDEPEIDEAGEDGASEEDGFRLDGLQIKNAKLVHHGPAGRTTLLANAWMLGLGDDQPEGKLRYKVTHHGRTAGGALLAIGAGSGAVTLTDTKSWSLDLKLSELTARAPGVRLDGGEGTARLTLGADSTDVHGQMTAGALGIGGRVIRNLTLSATYGPAGLAAKLLLPGKSKNAPALAFDLRSSVSDQQAPIRFTVTAKADAAIADHLAADLTGWYGLSARGRVGLEGTGTLPADGLPPLERLVGMAIKGRLSVRVAGVGNAVLRQPKIQGAVNFEYAGGLLTVDGKGPLLISADRLQPRLIGVRWPTELENLLGRHPRLRLGAGQAFSASLSPLEEGYRVALKLPFSLDADDLHQGSFDLKGGIDLLDAGGWRARIDRLRAGARRLRVAGLASRDPRLEFSGTAGPGALKGKFKISVSGGVTQPTLKATGKIAAAGQIAMRQVGGRISFTSAELQADQLQAGQLQAPGAELTLRAPASLKARQDLPTLLTWGQGVGDQGVRVQVGLEAARIAITRDGRAIDLAWKDLVLRHFGDLVTDGANSEVSLSEFELALPEDQISLAAPHLVAKFTHTDQGLALAGVEMASGQLSDPGEQPRFPPVELAGRATARDDGSGDLDLLIEATLFTGAVRLAAKGRHAAKSGAGRLDLVPSRLVLAGVPPDSRAFGFSLANWIDHWSGEIGLVGHLGWAKGALEGELAANLDGVNAEGPDGSIEGLRGALTFSGPTPLVTRGVQVVAADKLEFGMALDQPRAKVRLALDGRLLVPEASAVLAGGRMRLVDVTVDPADGSISGKLIVSGMGLQPLAALARLDGLSASGALGGVVPFSWTPDKGLLIPESRLTASGPGVVWYDPDPVPVALAGAGEQVGLMLQAVQNFHYEDLSVTLSGSPGQDMVMTLALAGSNPDLHGGHPLQFNLNLSGQLNDILGAALKTYRLPDTIRQRIKEHVGG